MSGRASLIAKMTMTAKCFTPIFALGLFLCFSVNGAERCTGKDRAVVYTDRSCASLGLSHVRSVESSSLPPGQASQQQSGPDRNTIRFYYSRLKEPWGVKHYEMDEMLRYAAAVWTQGCGVKIEYAGVANYGHDSAPVVKWSNELWSQNTKRFDMQRTLGRASAGGNVELTTDAMMNDPVVVRRVLLHELGHVLGIDHIRSNPLAVMYPETTPANTRVTSLSVEDRRACVEAMQVRLSNTHPVQRDRNVLKFDTFLSRFKKSKGLAIELTP